MFADRSERPRSRALPTDAPTPPLTLGLLQRLGGYLKPHLGKLALALLALLASSGLGLLFPMVIVRLLDTVTQAADSGALNQLTLALGAVFLVQAGFSFLQQYLLAQIGERLVVDLRSKLYRQLQSLSLAFYSEHRVGEIVSRLSSDVTQMRSLLTTNLTMLLTQVVSLIGALIIVFSMNAQLTLFILAIVPALIGVAIVFGSRIHRASMQVQDQLAESTTVAEEALQAVRVVRSFGREEHEVQRYEHSLAKTLKAALRIALYNSGFAALMMALGFGSIAAIMWYGGQEVIAGHLTLPMITGFLIYALTIAMSLGGLAGLYGQVRAALGGVQRVFELLDLKPTVIDAPDAVALPASRGRITFDDVAFSYDPRTPVLQGIALDVAPGEILALVGPSGAGKSTLFNLIPRFYDPTEGAIRIDGLDARAVTQASLRDQMAIVPQETMLFGGTIRDNILYGRLDATEAEVIAAARAANAHTFIEEFPDGYDTIVGERGTRLSGGQRQRIAIARAILKDPAILLLDEATSSLDNESEGLVQEALNRLMHGRTTVIIAHRLSTIKMAHRIAVLEAGRITELGTHDELMALGGTYARLYAMQFRDSETEGSPSNPARAPEPDAAEATPRPAQPGLMQRLGWGGIAS